MATLFVIHDILWALDKPRGGQAMLTLQWLEGLRRLGHQPIFLDHFTYLPEQHGELPRQRFERMIGRWWNLNAAALVDKTTGRSIAGLDDSQLRRLADSAAAVISIGGTYAEPPPPCARNVRPRVLVEQDPAYTHLWAERNSPAEIFGEHDFYFTVGANVGTDRCRVPTHGLQWRPVWNPVVMEWWPQAAPVTRQRFTTITGWWDQGYLQFEGQVLGPKAEEFKKIIDLPRRVDRCLEIALDIEERSPDLPLLKSHGWHIEDPDVVQTPEMYRDYVAGSLGEFTVAKGGYAGTNCGWFSDRSACYLAAGRPVITLDTGIARVLPVGRGLLTFRTIDEAADAIEAVRADHAAHCAAARDIAREHFNFDRVLPPFLRQIGIG